MPPFRTIWQNRATRISAFVATGDVHLVASILSLAILTLSLLGRYISGIYKQKRGICAEIDDASKHFVPVSFALVNLAACVASCSLGWVLECWKRSLLLTYVVLLGVLRFICVPEAQGQMYNHMNAMSTVAFVLAAVQYALPITIIGSTYRPEPLEIGLLCTLFVTIAVASLTPRPRRAGPGDDEEPELPIIEETSPEETCSLISYYCSYEWISYVILLGCRKDLAMEDLPPLPEYDEPLCWLEKIRKQRVRGGRTFCTLCRLLSTEIRAMVALSAITAVVDFMAPFAMLRLLAYLEDPSSGIVHPLIWIALLLLGPISRSFSYQHYIFTATRLLVRLNAALVQEIYRTALRSHFYDKSVVDESLHETGKSDQADLISLMSYDVNAIYNSRDIFYVLTGVPISTIIAMIFLYHMLGWPSLFGVLALVCLTPLPAMASRRVSRIQRSVMQATDTRLARISEYLNSIRTLKYFGWESAALDQISKTRELEQNRLWKRSIYGAIVTMAGDLVPFISLLVMFSVLVIFTDRPLKAPLAFTSLSIMETLRSQYVWLSNVSRNSAQGSESIRRVDEFFESAEEVHRLPPGAPEFKHATFRRTPIAAFRLHDLSVRFQQNALNVITGPTGSGKTSLLLSLLGETVLESGSATCPRDVAYVPQSPWLLNSSIRQNIIFFSNFDEARYRAVVEASGLLQDLHRLPAGDGTVVGEKGTALSGGQKQRVSLARALYSQSSTLVLDDVFSALDTHTTSLIYEKCFRSDFLANRTVVLVTHYPVALQDAKLIVALKHGTVSSVETGLLASANEVRLLSGGDETQNEDSQNGQVETIPAPLSITKSHVHEISGGLSKETKATGRVPRTLCKLLSYEKEGLC